MAPGSKAELHHFIGKDIVNFHGLFWPAMLHGAGMRAPTRLHVNGYLTVDGAKMSKSRGPFVMARTYLDSGLPPEALLYYFAAKSSGGVDDLDLNLADFVARVNADVVGKFVNLASRCAGFIGKRFDGRLAPALPEPDMYARFVAALAPIREAYKRNEAASVLRQTMALADEANRYIDDRKPWVIAKQDGADAELQAVCTQGLNLFRVLALALAPVLPVMSRQVAGFMAAPLQHWNDADAPLLSGFADAACDAALAAAFAERVPDEEPRGLAVIALGKLGSHELNYSSDIDPILIFDPATLPRRYIGRAACRERVCTYGEISAGAVSLKKKETQSKHH